MTHPMQQDPPLKGNGMSPPMVENADAGARRKTALIVEGGAMRGAWAAGVSSCACCRSWAGTPEELYPDCEDLRDMREALSDGWLVATNLNNVLKKTIIRLATEVAGLSFGKDVIVEF
jgi:hypothetical protein